MHKNVGKNPNYIGQSNTDVTSYIDKNVGVTFANAQMGDVRI